MIKKNKNTPTDLDFKSIFNQVSDFIQQCDSKGMVVNANEKWFEVLGYKKTDLGKINIKDFVHPDHHQKCFNGLKKVFSGESVSDIDIILKTKKGKNVYVKANASPFRDKSGKIVSTLSIFRDVSVEKEAAAKIISEQEKIKNYLNIAGVMIVSLDASGRVTLANEKACKILEDSQEKIIGKNWFNSFLPAEIKKEVLQVFNQLMKGDIKPVEYHENEILTKKRNKKIISFHNRILRDDKGNISGILFSGEDITARKKAEQEILLYQEKLETIFDNSNDIIVQTNKFGNIISINKAVKKILGYSQNEVVGRNFLKLKIIKPKELPTILNFFEDCIKTGKLVNPVNIILLRKDKKEVMIEASTSIIKKNGKIDGVISLLRDVTERHSMKKLISESQGRLQSLVKYLNDPICILDKNLKYLYANDRYLLRINKKLEEIMGRDYGNFHFPGDAREFKERVKKVFKDGVPFVYGHKSERDGEYFLRTISPIKDDDKGEVVSITVISRDITSQQKAEESLKNHAEELEKLNNLMLGRELKMIELKKKINELSAQLSDNK